MVVITKYPRGSETERPYPPTNNCGIGWEWKHATIFMLVWFWLIFIYIVVQAQQRPNFEWYTLLNRHSSRMFAWTAIYGFAFCQLPGIVLRFGKQLGLSVADNGEDSPAWLRAIHWGVKIRKQVGLLSLYFVSLHACMVLLIFGEEYYGYKFENGGAMAWNDEAAMLCAVLSLSLYVIVGIASLPSVQKAMNPPQFALVFGPVVMTALALGTMHVMFLGVPSWTAEPRSPYAWAGGMPPSNLFASLVPLIVLFLKFLQVVHRAGLALYKSYGGGGETAAEPHSVAIPDLERALDEDDPNDTQTSN